MKLFLQATLIVLLSCLVLCARSQAEQESGSKDSTHQTITKTLTAFDQNSIEQEMHKLDSLFAKESDSIANRRMTGFLMLGGITLLITVIMLVGFAIFIVHSNRVITKEKQKSDELLLNILPFEVAEELKENGNITAKHFENVTVLFTDFVNFTNVSENMDAQSLIDELNVCFKVFDEITTKYQIEKIKTIGDAYLAVAGLPTPFPEHATNTINAAKEILEFVNQRYVELGNKTFQVRIGIHSGKVVAGIVGVKKFAYDVWGDAVNTAARMEQNGMPSKINISDATYELAKDKFMFEYRGEIEAKNKGKLKMYFVS